MIKKSMFEKVDVFGLVSNNLAWAMLSLIVIYFGITSEHFFSFRNIINILNQNSYLLVSSWGLTMLMMAGGMDISVGWSMSVAGVICGLLLVKVGLPVWLCIVLTLMVTIAISLFNTFLAIKLKIDILFVSIAMMTTLQGASYIISNSKTIVGFPDSFKAIGQGKLFGVLPIGIVIMIVTFAIMSFILNKTYYGRYVYALGGNKEAARLAGININQMRYSLAILVGLFVGIGVIMLISRLGSAQAALGPGTEFGIIGGVLLGGVSVRGGEGKLSGVLAGILFVALLSNGLQLANVNIYYQYVMKGIIMVAAIGFDVFQLNRRQGMNK